MFDKDTFFYSKNKIVGRPNTKPVVKVLRPRIPSNDYHGSNPPSSVFNFFQHVYLFNSMPTLEKRIREGDQNFLVLLRLGQIKNILTFTTPNQGINMKQLLNI